MRYKPWGQSENYLHADTAGIKVLITQPARPFPQYDKFDFSWDEEEMCFNAVRTVVETACPRPEVWQEWEDFWSKIPKKVEDVQSKWDITSVRPRVQAQVEASSLHDVPLPQAEFRDSRLIVSHAVLPRTARNRVVRELQKQQNLRHEADHAKTLRPLPKNEFVAFIVESDFWDQRGFTPEERQLKICIGQLVNAEETINPEDDVRVSMFRCVSGDINNSWIPAIKEGSKAAIRVVGISRGSIIYHLTAFFTSSRRLLATVKKGMGSYFLCPYHCPKKDATLVLRK